MSYRYPNSSINIGPLGVTLHKTVRVPAGEAPASLPPSLGHFELYRVEDFNEVCPPTWNRNGYFFLIEDKEAMWMSFHASNGCAVSISAGGLNCINGEKTIEALMEGSYVVCPGQPWLDGWKSEDGKVYQFCGTPFKAGDGLTVAEQIIGDESKDGGIEFRVFDATDPELVRRSTNGRWNSGLTLGGDSSLEACFSAPQAYGMTAKSAARGLSAAPMSEMGLGRGGAIEQKIYPDPYGIQTWNNEPTAVLNIYMVSAEALRYQRAQTHVVADEYYGVWFRLLDGHKGDVSGSEKFKEIAQVTDAPSN